MFAFREIVNARRDELAAIITDEHGKVLSDAAGEVQRGLEIIEFACGAGPLLRSGFVENVSTGVDSYNIRQPLGVVGVISPFNFPVMVPLWFVPIAIAAGNAVVLKPSEKDPSAAVKLAEFFVEAGLPEGVFNVVHGDKEAVDALLDAPRHQGRVVRRLNADRAIRVRDRNRPRQAGAGARWREEPHDRAAGCRPGPGRRRCRLGRIRLGRGAVHGDLGRRGR